MSDVLNPDMARAIRLPVHFDVPVHALRADDYVVAISALNTCLKEFNKRIFENNLDLEFMVVTNEDGSIKAVSGILVKGWKGAAKLTIKAVTALFILGEAIQISETTTAKEIIKVSTGYEIDHAYLVDQGALVLHNLLLKFFQTENDNLIPLIPLEINLDKAIKAKSDFYFMCYHNPIINAVGYDDTNNFPIQRSRFLAHTAKDRIRPVPSDYVLSQVIVVSPVDVDKDTQWEFQDKNSKKTIRAYMRDVSFKRSFLDGKFPMKKTNSDDYMTILVEYQKREKNGDIESGEVSVHTVYAFNDTDITPIPAEYSLGRAVTKLGHMPMESLWTADA